MGIETAAVAAPKAAEAAGASKGAEGAGLLGGGKGAEAAGAGLAGGTDLLSGGFATAADLTAGGATGLAEGTGFATAADLAAPATGAGLAGFSGATSFGPSTGAFSGGSGFGATGGSGLDAFAQAPGGNTLPGAGTNTFGAPPSGVLDAPGAGAPSPASATGLSGTGVTPSPLSLDPTSAAAQGAGGASTAAGGAGTGAAAPAASGNAFSLESLLGGAGKSIAANPLGTALAAGGLGYNVLQGQQTSAAQKRLQEQASSLNAQGQQLASYLLNGNLPPGLQSSLDTATASAKARVRSNFAAQGMSTDPAKNTALAQELQMIDTQAVITTAQIGQQLLSSGQAASGLSSQVYTTLANLDQTQTQRIGAAVANMAQALSPGGGKNGNVTVNLGGK